MSHRSAILAILLIISVAFFACGDGGNGSDGDGDADGDGDGDGDSDGDTECPTTCPPGQYCRDGHCVSSCSGPGECPSPLECCNGICVNTREDALNCGSCGNPCAPYGDACIGSVCSCNGAMACTAPLVCCGTDGCVDTQTDRRHCDGCGNTCAGNCIDGDCESCATDLHEESGGNTCFTAEPLGDLVDTGDHLVVMGNLYPDGDVDCFWFTAIDSDDSTTGCDAFHLDIRFNANPDDQFTLEVYSGTCENPLCEDTSYNYFSWATDFFIETGDEKLGECDCTLPPENPEDPSTTDDTTQECADNTAIYRFCVVRASGDPLDCAYYEVTISNGVYDTPIS